MRCGTPRGNCRTDLIDETLYSLTPDFTKRTTICLLCWPYPRRNRLRFSAPSEWIYQSKRETRYHRDDCFDISCLNYIDIWEYNVINAETSTTKAYKR